MMLAEVSTDVPKLFAEWAACLAFALLLVNEGIKFAKSVRGKSGQPPNELLGATQEGLDRRVTKLEGEIVSKSWFTKMELEMGRLRTEATTHRENKDRQDSIHRASIYRAIKESEVKTNEHIENVRRELTDAQRTLPNEIVTLLKNTNAI